MVLMENYSWPLLRTAVTAATFAFAFEFILMSQRSFRWRARFIGASRYADIFTRAISFSAYEEGRTFQIFEDCLTYVELCRGVII